MIMLHKNAFFSYIWTKVGTVAKVANRAAGADRAGRNYLEHRANRAFEFFRARG